MTKNKLITFLESDSEWGNLRNFILNLHEIKSRCFCCGKKGSLTKHHIFPQKNGKKKGILLVCRECHDSIEALKECISLLNEEIKLTITKLHKTKKTMDMIK